MSNINRQGLQIIAESLGRAREALMAPLGDASRRPGALLALETALCRLRTATAFHDTDSATGLLLFEESDPLGLGIQGGKLIAATRQASQFPVIPDGGSWNPYYYGPPSAEGWGFWDYNAWAGWIPKDEDGNPVYTINGSEPTSGSQRLTKNHPIRWNGSAYEKVPFFESARWISFYNSNPSSYDDLSEVVFFLPDEMIEGYRHSDHADDLPLDLKFYSSVDLIQQQTSGEWEPLLSSPTLYSELEILAYDIERTTNGYTIRLHTVNDPAFVWGSNLWWHVAMYWGSQDNLPDTSYSEYTAYEPSVENILFWPRKNFFRTQIYDNIDWMPTGINDLSQYLTAQNRTHFSYQDGEYSSPLTPSRYKLPSPFPPAPVRGLNDSFTGYSTARKAEVIPAILCAKTQGSAYDDPFVEYQIIIAPPMPSELWPADWSLCPYFPPLPQDHVLLARLILGRAPGSIYNLVEGTTNNGNGTIISSDEETPTVKNILANLAIIWMEQSVKTFAQPPHGDPLLASLVLPEAYQLAQVFRILDFRNPTRAAAFDLLLPAARFPATLASTQSQLLDVSQRPSKVFRGLLKNPINPDLQNLDNAPPRAISFKSPARAVIEDLAGVAPSTEMARLNSNRLSLTGEQLNIANSFEVYMEPSDQCQAIDPNSAGISLGQDYTLRLELEDENENVLTKNLFVMASKFFLPDAEYSRRSIAGQSNTGYYRQGTRQDQQNLAAGTLETINEWRLHGYAGLIPDLTMGESRPIRTRVVSPPDETKETEEQFRKRLANQGNTQEEIEEAVQVFLDEGGEFLVIDLSQYPESWVKLRNIGVSVAQYAFVDVPYWKINLNPYFGLTNDVGDDENPSVDEVRADSFTIAPAGLSAGDLEQYGTQSATALDPDLNQTSGGNIGTFDKYVAFKLSTTERTSVTSFSLRMKVELESEFAELTNEISAKLASYLYADNDGVPGERLITGGSVNFSAIPTADYAEMIFSLQYAFASDRNYWIVIEKSVSEIGGTISFDYATSVNEKIAKPDLNSVWTTEAGDAWIKFYQVTNEVYGAFNRDTSNILRFLPPPNKTRETLPVYRVDGHWAYTCKRFGTPQQLSIYPRAFYNGSQWVYARFANDINVCVRYFVDGEIRTLLHTFSASPSWRSQWWKRSSLDYNTVDLSVAPDKSEIITAVDYTNISIDGQTEYINGRLEGSFTPLYNEIYTINVTSSQGVRVYVNDVLVIDQWLNASLNTFTSVLGVLSNVVANRIVVEHFHATGSQRLRVRWQSVSQSLANIGPSTSQDPTPTPLLIDADKIQNLTYLSVGKTLTEISTPTHGAPPGDRIVIRSA